MICECVTSDRKHDTIGHKVGPDPDGFYETIYTYYKCLTCEREWYSYVGPMSVNEINLDEYRNERNFPNHSSA